MPITATRHEDTLVIQHHVDVSELNCRHRGDALIQTGHGDVRVSVGADGAILNVQFVLITGHGELWTNNTGVKRRLECYGLRVPQQRL